MRNDFESNYLAHHGILGQKWGHKNGPPYPLDASDHSSSEKKAGYKKSIGGGRNEELYSKRQLRNRKGKNFDKDTEEYKHAKLRQGKNIINKRAGDEYNKSKADERTIKQYLKKYGGEKYDEDKIASDYQKWQRDLVKKYDKEHGRGSEEDKAILSNKKEIASSMAKEMTSDIKRWVKEGQVSMPKSFAGKSDSEIENQIAKKLEKNIANYDFEHIFKFSSGIVNFNIDGIEEYSDYQPLTIDYDIKNKKVKNFYYL